MLLPESALQISRLLRTIDQPFRLRILAILGEGEACVCHLERLLGKRQAYISQHLMALRAAGLLSSRREGKYIYYRLKQAEILDLLGEAASLAGVRPPAASPQGLLKILPSCECPNCSPSIKNSSMETIGQSRSGKKL
jgi:ArsR family transcriptional regulator